MIARLIAVVVLVTVPTTAAAQEARVIPGLHQAEPPAPPEAPWLLPIRLVLQLGIHFLPDGYGRHDGGFEMSLGSSGDDPGRTWAVGVAARLPLLPWLEGEVGLSTRLGLTGTVADGDSLTRLCGGVWTNDGYYHRFGPDLYFLHGLAYMHATSALRAGVGLELGLVHGNTGVWFAAECSTTGRRVEAELGDTDLWTLGVPLMTGLAFGPQRRVEVSLLYTPRWVVGGDWSINLGELGIRFGVLVL